MKCLAEKTSGTPMLIGKINPAAASPRVQSWPTTAPGAQWI
jgi:hypothetical protein